MHDVHIFVGLSSYVFHMSVPICFIFISYVLVFLIEAVSVGATTCKARTLVFVSNKDHSSSSLDLRLGSQCKFVFISI